MSEHVDFREALDRLRGVCPPGKPVRVRRIKLGDMGDVCRTPRQFSIRVSTFRDWTREELIEQLQVLVLIHEWAHALSPTWALDGGRRPSHGGHFGVGYADAYNAVFPPTE